MAGDKRITMEDIAKALDISKNAVSLALRGKDGVSPKLRERVIETARVMRYKGLANPSVKGNILALIPSYMNLSTLGNASFYHQVCFAMEAYARTCGYQLIISSVPESEERVPVPPAILDSINCVGIIAVGTLSLPYCRMLSELGTRFVMADQYYEELMVNSVTTANISGAYVLTRHLIDNGHRRIDFFGKRYTSASLNDRFEGYRRAMNEFSLNIRRNEYQNDRSIGHDNEFESLERAFTKMDSLPTAIICGHDNTAFNAINVLKGLGLEYPENISVVGFDDIQTPQIQELKLTTYRTSKEDIAHTSVDLFIESTGRMPRNISIYGEMIRRESVRDIRHIE